MAELPDQPFTRAAAKVSREPTAEVSEFVLLPLAAQKLLQLRKALGRCAARNPVIDCTRRSGMIPDGAAINETGYRAQPRMTRASTKATKANIAIDRDEEATIAA